VVPKRSRSKAATKAASKAASKLEGSPRAATKTAMSRHSKNATATTHFTYHEKTAAGHGTLKRRFGKDAQLPFGVCCLCLSSTHAGKSPLVSPGGFVYCKECIYANLLAQKRAIQENVLAYERFCDRKRQEEQDAVVAGERAQLQKFLDASTGSTLSGSVLADAAAPADKGAVEAKLREKVDRATDEAKREAMKRTSFWIPDNTPTADVVVDKPDTKTRDPMSLEEMKLKHLMPVKFEWSTPAEDGGKEAPHVLCAVTKKEITHHQAVLLRPSGQVILESCLKDMVLPTMTCPVTGLKLRKKDIIKLQAGGTGFSAHSTVEAKKYRPSMT
jgi:nitric oxide synthase-interacting protein